MAFEPRLSVHTVGNRTSEMLNYSGGVIVSGNAWWYSSGNELYRYGYGLPNCTCYAYGRYAEIRNGFASLPLGNAGDWYASATSFQRGQTPRLGAIICMGGTGDGHVGIVEQINSDGSIVTSNSGYNRDGQSPYYGGYENPHYFFTETLYPQNNYMPAWAILQGYHFQGFIYNDGGGTPISDYVISAIAGVWNIESGLNPSIWESLYIPPQRWSAIYYENTGGYGLGAWTNVETEYGVAWTLRNMADWCRQNNYLVNDTNGYIEPLAQLQYFLINDSQWVHSQYAPYQYATFNDFLSSSSTSINNLVTEFFCNWESGGFLNPANPDWKVAERQYSAQIAYSFIQQHKNDDSSNYQWLGVYNNGVADQYVNQYIANIPSSPNDNLSNVTYNNLMCMYFYLLQGYSPTPPTPPPPTHKKMPLWMMLRRLYR